MISGQWVGSCSAIRKKEIEDKGNPGGKEGGTPYLEWLAKLGSIVGVLLAEWLVQIRRWSSATPFCPCSSTISITNTYQPDPFLLCFRNILEIDKDHGLSYGTKWWLLCIICDHQINRCPKSSQEIKRHPSCASSSPVCLLAPLLGERILFVMDESQSALPGFCLVWNL